MAYNTFTLRVQDTTPDAVKPTFVYVFAWPLASNDGARLKRLKDNNTGKTITGHVVHRASPAEIMAGVVDVVLPDPRDTTLNPTAFGWEVRVETNYFKQESVTFGSAELDLYASGGVLLYGKVAPVDAALFTATTSYVVKPTGGADGQALVKSGTDVVWGTVAGGPGGGAVASVNSKTGAVVLTASDVGADAAGAATAAQSAAISAAATDATSKANSAQAAAISTAATDATTKANAAQAAAVQRANHTGTQTSATISDFTAAVTALAGRVLVVDNGNGTAEVTVTGGGFSLVDNGNGTASLTLNGQTATVGAQYPELAYAENVTATSQSIAASATGGGGNFTDITGCIIVVPASTRPVYLSAAFTASLTAAPVNSLGLVFLRIVEVSNGVDTPITWQAEQNVGGAGQFASVTPALPPRRLGTTARTRTFKLQVGDYQAAVSVTNSAQSASFIAAEAR